MTILGGIIGCIIAALFMLITGIREPLVLWIIAGGLMIGGLME